MQVLRLYNQKAPLRNKKTSAQCDSRLGTGEGGVYQICIAYYALISASLVQMVAG
jgi:hypothetical protein